ncbi:Uncharacterised protein (plasmid) [Tsukamurella tyrosinosolvens]|uniref:TIR domain-containing protein n=1 Tax=Tsukamurella tyrosinosolvens TaxID=57704 RepID=A0A1H4I7I3_TSUTY|nr:toll/interleukin-1 receptor domain-containing protein [Tsukamurella tyrosinosolvens]SEB29726.1 TIR domain-containing protein [Tsukamurella tyrosinosolvens]VEH95819.1 Uncharacterised protein [Tsukamurella tyrosinosolvens]
MSADLFISYAWTSEQHRQWVRLLASQLKALGFDVLIDADLDYGDQLTGFMRRVVECRHVLLIADDNYVDRADTLPDSGVGKENHSISEVYAERPGTWVAVLFKDNLHYRLPAWLADTRPKGISFNYDPAAPANFPGSEQIEDLWRWIEGLPANRDSATPVSTLRERAARLERQALKTAPSQWRNPSVEGEVRFTFADAPRNAYRWGLGDSEFAFEATSHGPDSIFVYKDQIKAVGILRADGVDDHDLAGQLVPGRNVIAREGNTVVLMNEHGRLATVEIIKVQHENIYGGQYTAPYVDIRWKVVDTS